MTENKDPGEAVAPVSALTVLMDAMLDQAHMARRGLSKITICYDPKQLAAMKQAHAAFAELHRRSLDAVTLLEGIAPHHPQTAELRAAHGRVSGVS